MEKRRPIAKHHQVEAGSEGKKQASVGMSPRLWVHLLRKLTSTKYSSPRKQEGCRCIEEVVDVGGSVII